MPKLASGDISAKPRASRRRNPRALQSEPNAQQTPSAAPSYAEISSPQELANPQRVLNGLRSIDWAFAKEDTQYLSHDIHPYPAKFIPQLPGNLIARLSLRGEVVLDPFSGSGTTALEALRLGRRAIGVDANPISEIIGRVKTCRLDPDSEAELTSFKEYLKARQNHVSSSNGPVINEHARYVPEIPNIEKWFAPTACAELALIRSMMASLKYSVAKDVASVVLSRIAMRVCFQDSETRYASRPREIPQGETLRLYLRDLEQLVSTSQGLADELRFGQADFHTADARSLDSRTVEDESVDLVVTSPPYGNANDYHLYHRFRLFWLGFDPKRFGSIEVGSHLRHQRQGTGFESYLEDMKLCVQGMARVLRSGRYAALVVGDAVYDGEKYSAAEAFAQLGKECGLEAIGAIERPLPLLKRSFVAPGRRLQSESIVILRKPSRQIKVRLSAPVYRMWPYEAVLRGREIQAVLGGDIKRSGTQVEVTCDPYVLPLTRSLAFTTSVAGGGMPFQTWQAILENGFASDPGSRKDPKYVTHGIHAYKGKFYPQLAKALINVSGCPTGSIVLDPFCGSGTTVLESHINGLQAYGCDLNPLAAQIARAKVGILNESPKVLSQLVKTLEAHLTAPPSVFPTSLDQFKSDCVPEIVSWFPLPVARKLNWLLQVIRSISSEIIRDFFEVILSSIVREVSHQDPDDLRIRRRKKPLADADVIGLYRSKLSNQVERLERFWKCRSFSPNKMHAATVRQGDSRDASSYQALGLKRGSVDLVLTSPPYATALPYIDTDRLSLLVLHCYTATKRRPLEQDLIGSREIGIRTRDSFEDLLSSRKVDLPNGIINFLLKLAETNCSDEVGFRKRNMPALLLRFFSDLRVVLGHCHDLLKTGGQAMVVIGDNTTEIDGRKTRIPTTDFTAAVAEDAGLVLQERIPISVTTENLNHIKNAIKMNTVLWLKKA